MNKSLEYIIELSKDEARTNIPRTGWEDADILNTLDTTNSLFGNSIAQAVKDGKLKIVIGSLGDITRDVEIQFNNNPNFNYFTSKSITHDGTLIFTTNALADVLYSVLTGNTYNKDMLTEDMINNIYDYKMIYIVGDIIIHNDFGMKNINGVDMMGQDTFVCLPIEYRIERRV